MTDSIHRPEVGAFEEARRALIYIWTHPANRGRRVRVLGRAVAFQVRGRLLRRPTIAPIGERSKIQLLPGHGQAGLLYANPPEFPEIAFWRRHLSPGDLFVDVGANVGSYTLWAIEQGAEVIAVEPDAWAVEQLAANLALNGYTADVRRVAVADAIGEVRFTTGKGVLNHLSDDAEGDGVTTVPAVTLDDLVGSREVAGVKVDVEGAELLVARGAETLLRERRVAALQFEWNPCSGRFSSERQALADFLVGHGYALMRPDARGELQPIASTGPGPDVFAWRT